MAREIEKVRETPPRSCPGRPEAPSGLPTPPGPTKRNDDATPASRAETKGDMNNNRSRAARQPAPTNSGASRPPPSGAGNENPLREGGVEGIGYDWEVARGFNGDRRDPLPC